MDQKALQTLDQTNQGGDLRKLGVPFLTQDTSTEP